MDKIMELKLKARLLEQIIREVDYLKEEFGGCERDDYCILIPSPERTQQEEETDVYLDSLLEKIGELF